MSTGLHRGSCPLCNSTQFAVELDSECRAIRARCYYNRCPSTAILAALKGTPPGQLQLSPVAYDAARNRAAALRTWNFSQDVKGTLAERYLREARSIASVKLSASLRYNANVLHPSSGPDTYFPALIACAETSDGKFAGINRTWLDANSDDLQLHADPRKAILGTGPGAVVRLTPYLSETITLVEGIEDALSLLEADPNSTVWATLGTKLGSVRLPSTVTTVILAGDNDPPGRKAVYAAVRIYGRQGRNVQTVFPPFRFKDCNDQLRAGRA